MTRAAQSISKVLRTSRLPLTHRSTPLRSSIAIHHVSQMAFSPQMSGSSHLRSFTSTPKSALAPSQPTAKGLSPESEDPHPKEAEASHLASSATDLTPEQFHELSDQYLDALIEKLEHMAEENEAVDVEYSAGVLTLNFPPNGIYVINKQPPNKQIWLSSPISGPKRYDYVVFSEGQDAKEDTGMADWVYLRDGSTMSDLLQTELGLDVMGLTGEGGTPPAATADAGVKE